MTVAVPARAADVWRRRAARVLPPALAGLVLGVLALGPGLGPGFVLRYDMVFVPDPPVAWPGGGFPRSVPSDLVVALLALVLPAQAVQKAILLGIFVLAATGAAALVPGGRTVPRLAAAVFYAWNAYLAQRLLLGQWALLLGFAGLPWAVRAAARGGAVRLAVALLPAAVGGFQAMLVSAPAVLAVSAGVGERGRRWRRAAVAAGVLAVLSAPWAVPALLSDAATDPAGVDAFAARADGPYGTAGSVLALGGIWNAEAAVPGQEVWLPATIRLAVCLAAIGGYLWLGRGARPRWWAGLPAAAALGVAVALTGAFLPGVLKTLIGWWPGFGPLRDGQAYLAPLALLEAAGFGALAARVVPARRDAPGGRTSWPVAVVVLLAPVLVLPGLAWGAWGRLDAVAYPAEWRRVQALVNGDPAPGALVSLPWSAHRAFGWNGGRVTLDPAVKLFARRVLWNDELVVGLPGGGALRVRGEDAAAREIGALLAGGGPVTEALRARGVRYVLLSGSDRQNVFQSRLPGGAPVHVGPELTLVRL